MISRNIGKLQIIVNTYSLMFRRAFVNAKLHSVALSAKSLTLFALKSRSIK